MSDTPRTDAVVAPFIGRDDVSVEEAGLLLDNSRQLERELNEAKRDAARYEVVRKMNATQFAELLQRCLFQDLRFDDEVDRLAATRTIKMHLKVKEGGQ